MSQDTREVSISEKSLKSLIEFQRNEITEYHIYSRLAKVAKDKKNSEVLDRIAKDELSHYKVFRKHSKKDVREVRWKIFFYFWVARIFGLTFGIKLMERGEKNAQEEYEKFTEDLPEIERIVHDEEHHEQELIAMIREDKLNYIGSIVLGLNDALVELTGTLAGLSFALQNTRLIALVGLITGIAASLSMAASEYLSSKSEEEDAEEVSTALKSSIYTGIAYITTVIFLVLPYFLLENYLLSLGFTLGIAIVIIFVFNYYISVAKDLNFFKRFAEMSLISLGVALISFGIGYLVRSTLGVDV